MYPQSLSAPRNVLEHLLADQQWLEALLGQIRSASELNDRARLQKLRTELEWDLSAHLKAEETFLIPVVALSDAHGALMLLQNHEHLRTRLSELGAGADREFIPRDVLSRFIEELRAHARLGDSLWNQLSDDILDESRFDSAVTGMEGGFQEALAVRSAAA